MNPLTLIAKLCDVIDEAIANGDTIVSCPTVDVARRYIAEQSKPADAETMPAERFDGCGGDGA